MVFVDTRLSLLYAMKVPASLFLLISLFRSGICSLRQTELLHDGDVTNFGSDLDEFRRRQENEAIIALLRRHLKENPSSSRASLFFDDEDEPRSRESFLRSLSRRQNPSLYVEKKSTKRGPSPSFLGKRSFTASPFPAPSLSSMPLVPASSRLRSLDGAYAEKRAPRPNFLGKREALSAASPGKRRPAFIGKRFFPDDAEVIETGDENGAAPWKRAASPSFLGKRAPRPSFLGKRGARVPGFMGKRGWRDEGEEEEEWESKGKTDEGTFHDERTDGQMNGRLNGEMIQGNTDRLA